MLRTITGPAQFLALVLALLALCGCPPRMSHARIDGRRVAACEAP